APVRRVEIEPVHRRRTARVDRFQDHHPTGPELGRKQGEEAAELVGREVLDDLSSKDAVEAHVGEGRQVGERVCPEGGQSAVAAVVDHVLVNVYSGRVYAVVSQEFQEFAAPAADVEDGSPIAEQVEIDSLPPLNVRGRATEAVFEEEVIERPRR